MRIRPMGHARSVRVDHEPSMGTEALLTESSLDSPGLQFRGAFWEYSERRPGPLTCSMPFTTPIPMPDVAISSQVVDLRP
jgi:hypothetical protein